MNRLVIAEKPSVAKSLATVLGANTRRDGYFEGGGHLVSWCYGHLVELAHPAAYGEQYKRWSYDALPILPEAWQYTASKDKKKQLDTLRSLMNRADVECVINACDAGREGELIFRLVHEYCGCKKPIQRLWISSMEDAAIRAGFANLRNGAEYDHLYHAALCRARADWVTGINATRLFSILYGGATLNVGRVQSPTLAMMVSREAAVQDFTPELFYTPMLEVDSFTAAGERLKTPEEAQRIRAACDGKDVSVLSVDKKEKTEAPPRLYDLTSLQRDANRLLGYTAQQTLNYAQALYEKKLTTYPRTDSRYLTEDMAQGLPELVNLTVMRLPFVSVPVPVDASLVVDESKVTDHHALLPTHTVRDLDWGTLPTGEKNILTMLIVRLACAVGEAHTFEAVTAVLECAGVHFTAKGKTVLMEGWKTLDAAFRAWLKKGGVEDDAEYEGEDARPLPELTGGQVFQPVTVSVREGKTSPPKRYTEDTLLAAMETAGVEENLVTERKGLGTPATRAGVIEKLVRTGFVERKKKLLVPTDKGKNLIAVLPEEIKSPLLTAEWEQKLAQVERGELTGDAFMAGISALVQGLVTAHTTPLPQYASLFAKRPHADVVGKCPRCGADVVEGTKGFFCSSRACKFALWKDARFWQAKEKKLDKKIAATLLSDGRVFFSDLKSGRTGKTYAAAVVLEEAGGKVQYKLDFEQKNSSRRKAA